MAWVACDYDGDELVFDNQPIKIREHLFWGFYDKPRYSVVEDDMISSYGVTLPKGSIKKLIGRDLTWEDKPVELK